MSSSQPKQRAQNWADSQYSERYESSKRSRVRSVSLVSADIYYKDDMPTAKKARLREQDPDELSSIIVQTATTTPSSSTEFVWEPSEIQVGTYKECNKVAIFAKLNNATNPAISFKINLQEADRVSNIKFVKEKMNYDQVKFAPEFNRGSPSATKAYIKALFTRVPKPHLDALVENLSEEPTLVTALDQYNEASSSRGTGVGNSNESNGLTRNATPIPVVDPVSIPLPTSTIDSSTTRSRQRQSLIAILSGFEELVTGELKKNVKNVINGIDNLLINELNEKIATQKRELDEYKRRYGDLSNPILNSMSNDTIELAMIPSSVQRNGKGLAHTSNLEMKRFEVIDENRANGGMLTERVARSVAYEGRSFEETIILEELMIYKTKGTFNGTATIDGRSFTAFLQRDGSFRYLESPGPGNVGIVTADGGRKFAKWTFLKPVSQSEYPVGDTLPV
ncbi:hypothetical protein HYFRA_00001151 [Hymenoscyphus fraxineus]|uniref:Uncharacterized protein n=1 Tax=Hymenoscyphus fraxineus TaxID=746836 RepID=A0A9N9KRY6_9HELO|nr:hypothetical protein HYFRA_00001151 [Hymenoscyphus fraxineus]